MPRDCNICIIVIPNTSPSPFPILGAGSPCCAAVYASEAKVIKYRNVNGDITWRMLDTNWQAPPTQNSNLNVSCIAHSRGCLSPFATLLLKDSCNLSDKRFTFRLGFTVHISLCSSCRRYPAYKSSASQAPRVGVNENLHPL